MKKLPDDSLFPDGAGDADRLAEWKEILQTELESQRTRLRELIHELENSTWLDAPTEEEKASRVHDLLSRYGVNVGDREERRAPVRVVDTTVPVTRTGTTVPLSGPGSQAVFRAVSDPDQLLQTERTPDVGSERNDNRESGSAAAAGSAPCPDDRLARLAARLDRRLSSAGNGGKSNER